MPSDATNEKLGGTDLTQWELAEAEAASDILDADLEGHGAATPVPPRAPETFSRQAATGDADLADAETQSDLTHVDDGR